jgi:UDP-N-acetylglucosamine 2-epimerase (non-hydrolysing)
LAADAGLRGQLEAKFEKYKSKKNILVTCHRREIFGEGIKRICAAIAAIAKKYPDMSIIYPVHPNPNIYMVVQDMLAGIPNIKLIEPLSYTEFVYLMLDIDLIVTDSGGVQEESVSLGKATLVVRETTERPEALEFPLFKLVGTNTDNIIAEVVNYFDNQDNISDELQAILPFGKGNAADLILQSLKKYSGSLELDKNLVNA